MVIMCILCVCVQDISGAVRPDPWRLTCMLEMSILCCMAQETQTGALCQPGGVGWGGRWERASGGRGYMYAAAAKLLQSCLTLCDPIDGSPPGSAIPGILQARTLEWVAISSSNA